MAEAITENLWVAMTRQWGFPMRLRIETFAEPGCDRAPPVADPPTAPPDLAAMSTNTVELPATDNEGEFTGMTAPVQSS